MLRDLSDQIERDLLIVRELDRALAGLISIELIGESLHRLRPGVEPDVLFVRGKMNDVPAFSKGRHLP